MLDQFLKSLFFSLFLMSPWNLSAGENLCSSYLAAHGSSAVVISIKESFKLDRTQTKQLELMLVGLKNTSRSVSFSPLSFLGIGHHKKVTENFKKTALFVLKHRQDLGLDLETAVKFNEMLTQGIVDPRYIGDVSFRPHSKTRLKAKPFHLYPQAFYHWLETPEAQRLFETDPIRLAEMAHHTISALDSFPDGNGRLARIFADLILLKAGLHPAYYPTRAEYFTWNAASRATREQQLSRYIESVQLGQFYMEAP